MTGDMLGLELRLDLERMKVTTCQYVADHHAKIQAEVERQLGRQLTDEKLAELVRQNVEVSVRRMVQEEVGRRVRLMADALMHQRKVRDAIGAAVDAKLRGEHD